MARSSKLQAVVDRLAEAFDKAEVSAPGRMALERVFGRLAGSVGTAPVTEPGEPLPNSALFAAALAPLLTRADALAPLANALATLAPSLVWTTRKSIGPTASPGFAGAHANAMLIGPGSLEPREDVWVGLSLMTANTRYPDHDHTPEEVYLVLSCGAFLQGEAGWLERKPGDTVYNTPGIRHAMRAGDQPFLALWCLPV